MTNEELSMRIKAGESELIPQLWDQTVKFIRMQAGKYYAAKTDRGRCAVGYEQEDLEQAGFLALLAAVDYYNPDMDFRFLTVLSYTLKTAFAETSGTRTSRMRNDGLQKASSLDAPIGEEADSSLHDFLADEATSGDGSVEEQGTRALYLSQLGEALERGIALLPKRCQKLVRLRYFECKSWPEIAQVMNINRSRAQQMKLQALRKLYETSDDTGLSEFIEERTNYYLRVGRTRFGNTRCSAVEEIVLFRERMAEEWLYSNITET